MTAPDPITTWLDDHHIAWRHEPAHPLDDIDQLAGLANQARQKTLHDDVVDRYAADMEAGATFPPILLRRHHGAWTPVGGNHRIAAAGRAGRTHLPAILIDDIGALDARLLAIEDNRRHGYPLTDDGWTVDRAADVCGIAVHKVTRYLGARRGRQRAEHHGVEGIDELAVTTLFLCNQIDDDGAYTLLLELILDKQILISEISALTPRINNADDPLGYVRDIAQSQRGRTRRGGGRPPSIGRAPRARLISDLDGIMRIDVDAVLDDTHTATQRQQLTDQVLAAARHLAKLDRRLRPDAYPAGKGAA